MFFQPPQKNNRLVILFWPDDISRTHNKSPSCHNPDKCRDKFLNYFFVDIPYFYCQAKRVKRKFIFASDPPIGGAGNTGFNALYYSTNKIKNKRGRTCPHNITYSYRPSCCTAISKLAKFSIIIRSAKQIVEKKLAQNK